MTELDQFAIGQIDLKIEQVSNDLWALIEGLPNSRESGQARVPASKCLHTFFQSLLSRLTVFRPTISLVGMSQSFKMPRSGASKKPFKSFAAIARLAKTESYVRRGWNTSQTKVIDNAIVGLFILVEKVQAGNSPVSLEAFEDLTLVQRDVPFAVRPSTTEVLQQLLVTTFECAKP